MQGTAKGFSLLELLLVLVITVAIVALVSPRIANSLDVMQLKRLSRDIAASLRTTRTTAITSGKQAIWLVDFEHYHYQYTGKTVYYPDNIKLAVTTASKEVISDTAATIRFFSDGSSTGGEVSLTQGTLNYAIQIDWLTGRVKIYD